MESTDEGIDYRAKWQAAIAKLSEEKQFSDGLKNVIFLTAGQLETIKGNTATIMATQSEDHKTIMSHDDIIREWQAYQKTGKGFVLALFKLSGIFGVLGYAIKMIYQHFHPNA